MKDDIQNNDYDYTCGVSDDELSFRFKEAVKIENEIRKIKGLPISKYDFEKNIPYIEYPDGRKVYPEEVWNHSFRKVFKNKIMKDVFLCMIMFIL